MIVVQNEINDNETTGMGTRAVKFKKPVTKEFSCRLVSEREIEIQGRFYTVTSHDHAFAFLCYTLAEKHDNNTGYIVYHDAELDRNICNCPDYVYRRQGGPAMCKHGKALATLGYLPEPKFSENWA